MNKWTIVGLIVFLAITAVYNDQAKAVDGGGAVNPLSQVVNGNTSATLLPAPAAAGEVPTTNPATQPSNQGQSVQTSYVQVSEAGTMEIHFNNADLVEVLRMLSLQSQTNVLPSKDVHGSVTANLYGVTIREALDAILAANGYAYREKGNVIYVYTVAELADLEKKEKKTTTEVFHLYYTTAATAQIMIKPVLSETGQVAITGAAIVGIASDPSSAGGNAVATEDTMVVTDFPENIEKARKIIKDLDRRPQQILVEATILSATLNDNNAMGVDFTLLGGVSFANLATAAGSSSSPLQDALTGTILNNPTASGITKNGYSAVGTGFTQNVPMGGLRVGLISNNVAAFVQAVEETTDTVVLANPKVLVLNKQKGEVKVAREDAYRGKITTSESGVSTQEVDFLETGTVLIFRPYIADDGFIRLEIHPEDSTPLAAASSDLPPTKATTEATSNVIVKDGHTLVIGGMFREQTQIVRNQIPYLGTLPLAGPLFRSQQDVTTRSEVIILLTPHIIKDDLAYSEASQQQLKELNKMRVGVRHGMMITGRERLADTHYEAALAELNKPHPNQQKVIWNLNCATNLNSRFIEAIDLKEKVTGKTVEAADNSSIRHFVEQAILLDKAPAAPPTSDAGSATQPSGKSAAGSPTTQPAQAAATAVLKVAQAPATRPAQEGNSAAVDAALTQDFKVMEKEIVSRVMEENPAPTTQPASQDKTAENADQRKIPGANSTSITDISDSPTDDNPGN